MQQLSLPLPQFVIPGPPGAQLGGNTPESPPLLDPELPPELLPELLPEPDPLPLLEPLPEDEDEASVAPASLFTVPPFELQPPKTLAASTSLCRLGFIVALHPIFRLSLAPGSPVDFSSLKRLSQKPNSWLTQKAAPLLKDVISPGGCPICGSQHQ